MRKLDWPLFARYKLSDRKEVFLLEDIGQKKEQVVETTCGVT